MCIRPTLYCKLRETDRQTETESGIERVREKERERAVNLEHSIFVARIFVLLVLTDFFFLSFLNLHTYIHISFLLNICMPVIVILATHTGENEYSELSEHDLLAV